MPSSQRILPFKNGDVQRKERGRKKPQALRQAKKRLQNLKNKLNSQPKYHVTLESGREFVMNSIYSAFNADDAHSVAEEALEEAALMDDYLSDLRYIDG